eukprot:Skav207127  [mRNA]  locus=scaffold554:12286:13392:+ [translate_table: standard]
MSIHSAVYPGLFIGDVKSAKHYAALKSHGITHIAVIARSLEAQFPGSFEYLTIDLLDDGTDDLLVHLPKIFSFIDDALKQEHGKVLVHCFAGMSRSVSTVLAYLMRMWHVPFPLALGMFKETYHSAAPAANFCEQLRVFQEAGFHLGEDEPDGVVPKALRVYRLSRMSRDHRPATQLPHSVGILEEPRGPGDAKGSNGFWSLDALVALYVQQEMSLEVAEEKAMALATTTECTWNSVDFKVLKALREELQERTALADGKDVPVIGGRSKDVLDPQVCCCARCRQALFSSDHVLHDCTSGYYVETMQWMMTESPQGKLSCACGAKLGSFSWSGQACSCGQFRAPVFHIQKKKVEWMKLECGEVPKPQFG